MPVIEWVDASGKPTHDGGPQLVVEVGEESVDVVRVDGNDERRWSLPSALVGNVRGMPHVRATIDGGCEIPNTAAAVARTGTDPVTVTIEHRFGCDDSGGGANYDLTIGSAADGTTWHIQSATRRFLCLRGAVPEGCI